MSVYHCVITAFNIKKLVNVSAPAICSRDNLKEDDSLLLAVARERWKESDGWTMHQIGGIAELTREELLYHTQNASSSHSISLYSTNADS